MAPSIRLGLLPCLLFPLLLLAPAEGAIQPKVPALFAFGDELLDTGNCLALPGAPRLTDSKPYGLATFGKPTGRYSDGKLVVDHLGGCQMIKQNLSESGYSFGQEMSVRRVPTIDVRP